ncbi:hypothetical protein DY000_02006918 [Brassica cretica]|uniref:Uncharacterized protein n=2 Tax=Brassica cretica TaxID=69181 RepID=A0ABQ7CK57_BRACR|nr:hypothetical protein DY000_02006918 [Brassica cretica]
MVELEDNLKWMQSRGYRNSWIQLYGWMDGKLKDEPEAGMEHNELILAMKNKTNKLEKLWIRFIDELGLFQPKRRSNIQDNNPLSLADEPATKFKSKKPREQLCAWFILNQS